MMLTQISPCSGIAGGISTTSPRTSSCVPSPRSAAMNSSAVSSLVSAAVAIGQLPRVSIWNSNIWNFPSLHRPRHLFELRKRTRLLFGKEFAAESDVDVVPGEHLVNRPLAVAVERNVDSQVGKGLPPDPRVEVLTPGIETGTSGPGGFQSSGDSPIATGQDAFQHAPLDVVALHGH